MSGEKIDSKHPQWQSLLTACNIEHPSTVHHFEVKNSIGIPVSWSDVKIIQSASHRVLAS